MAGSISLAMSQQFDTLGKPLSGGQLFFIKAGTTSAPQNAFQDYALSIPYPNPFTLDSAGRIPAFYLADGFIKIRLTDKNGVQQIVQDMLLVMGPSTGGGGGGGGVDPSTVFQTGAFMQLYGTGALSGWVRGNGRTIGNATSGATERANADTSALFVYLWGADPNLAVSGGRGASGLADFSANKTITLPDVRGRVLGGLDDMGSAAAGRLSASYFGSNATTLGAIGGAESHTLITAQLASHTHSNTLTDPGHNHQELAGNGGAVSNNIVFAPGNNSASGSSQNTTANTTGISINNAAAGSGSAHNNVQPTLLVTTYLKL